MRRLKLQYCICVYNSLLTSSEVLKLRLRNLTYTFLLATTSQIKTLVQNTLHLIVLKIQIIRQYRPLNKPYLSDAVSKHHLCVFYKIVFERRINTYTYVDQRCNTMDVNIRLDNLELHKSCMNTRDCNNRRALVRVIINELERSLVPNVPSVNGSRFFK